MKPDRAQRHHGSPNRKSKIKNRKSSPAPFLTGVIEGFYGQPWSQAERFELFEWLRRFGLNTYLYAPKDDLKHRSHWRERYSANEAARLRALIRNCRKQKIRFIYALSPGLDIRYSDKSELDVLKKKFTQLMALGCRDFALLFDDIPDQMHPVDRKRWNSFALAQSHVTNVLYHWSRRPSIAGRFLFCPTAYCRRMADRQLGGAGYLETIGRQLVPEIDVLWTGPEIVSREITMADLENIGAVLRRRPVLWDNLHANDYDVRRFYCGPYSGRPAGIKSALNGVLANPNCEFPLNFVPLRTMAWFVQHRGHWDARRAYLSAMKDWLPRFATIGKSVSFDDLVLLGDCHYLPHEEGPEAERLYQSGRALLQSGPGARGDEAREFQHLACRLRDCCIRLTELRDRSLFHALSRRLWELREELDLLLGWIRLRSENRNARVAWLSDFHLPGTYRGGLLRRLEQLLTQQPDGTFAPAESAPADVAFPKSARKRRQRKSSPRLARKIANRKSTIANLKSKI